MNQSDIDLIKKHEGYKPRVYKDHLGFDTIGIGFKVDQLYLTEDVCETILTQKLSALELEITQKFDWFRTSHGNIKTVVLSMCYQMGVTGFSKFTKTISYLAVGDMDKASEEMLDSRWAREQTPARAQELSNLLKRGV